MLKSLFASAMNGRIEENKPKKKVLKKTPETEQQQKRTKWIKEMHRIGLKTTTTTTTNGSLS